MQQNMTLALSNTANTGMCKGKVFMIQEKKLIQSVAVYRFLAMIIVLCYHLVTIPTYSYEIVNVIKGSLDFHIIPANALASLDMFAFERFHTSAGTLAVSMFFIASGYLTSKMMDRYTKREYLVNRAISTFPTLWVSLAVVALFVYFSQGIVVSPSDILGSAFPFWPRLSGMFISAVLWTMRIEIKFYILAALFGKNRKDMVVYGYALILLSLIVYYEFRTPWLHAQMLDLSFMCFIFLGVVIEYVQRQNCSNGLKYVVACVLFNLLLFKISVWLFQDNSDRLTYPNCVTQIFPVLLFLLLLKIEQWFPKLYQIIPRFVYSTGKLVFPFYLTHVGCGLTVMYQMSVAGCNMYMTLLGGVLTSFVVAGFIYLLVTKPSGLLMKKVIAAMRKQH